MGLHPSAGVVTPITRLRFVGMTKHRKSETEQQHRDGYKQSQSKEERTQRAHAPSEAKSMNRARRIARAQARQAKRMADGRYGADTAKNSAVRASTVELSPE